MRVMGTLLQRVTLEDLRALVEDQIPESPVLEYKEALPGRSDGDRKEFLADVSAMANTSGGVIIYGIREQRDEHGKKTGLPEAIVGLEDQTPSDAQQRIEHMLRGGLDPSLSDFLVRTFLLEAERNVFILAIGVSASLVGPHAVAVASLPFWRRVGPNKASLSTAELRQMFLERNAWQQEAEAFRAERMLLHTTVQPGRIPANLGSDPALLLQALPLGRLGQWIDLRPHREELAGLFNFGNRSFNERYTFNGILRTGVMEDPLKRYVQWFRFGGVELYSANFGVRSRASDTPGLGIGQLTFYAVEYAHRALETMDELLGIPPPYAVFVNVLNVHGHVLELLGELRPSWPNEVFQAPIAETHLLPPPIVFDERSAEVEDSLAQMRMVLDSLWQAGGLAHCWMITAEGKWRGRDLAGWKEAL